MKDIILFENKDIKQRLQSIMPEDHACIAVDEIFKKRQDKKIISIVNNEELETLKRLFVNSDSINLVCSDEYYNSLDLIDKLIREFEIDFYAKIVLDNFDNENIQSSFMAAEPVDRKAIEQISARVKIDTLYDKEIVKILNWFFEKESILTKGEIEETKLSRLIIYALAVLVPNQLTIDNFIPEKLYRASIDYNYKNIQFRCKHKNKYKIDDIDELNIILNIAMNQNNDHMVETFDRRPADIAPSKPINKSSLQKDCSLSFGMSPKEVMSIAKELFDGVYIDGEKVSLITTVNTNSLRIGEERRAQIHEFIVKHYGAELYFNGIRNYPMTKDFETKEAILPRSFDDEYLPSKFSDFLTEDQYKIYNYIFLRSVASQMTNATYDDSVLVVDVAGEKFKAQANKILSNGWYEIGRLYDAELNIQSERHELPHELYVGARINDYKLMADKSPQDEKTPNRISMGVMFKRGIKELNTEEGEITALIDQLINSKLVTIVSEQMMIPTEKAKRIFFTLELFAPNLINMEFILETQKSLAAIKEGKQEKNVVIDQYLSEIATLRKNLEYSAEEEESIGGWKEREAQKIAKENGQKLPVHVLTSKSVLNDYVQNNSQQRVEKLGVCPDCKKGEVFEKGKGYFCNSNSCRFVLWKNVINKFFDFYKKDVDSETILDYVKIMLSKGSVNINNFYYNEEFFARRVEIAFNEKYNNWGFSFVKKEQKAKSILVSVTQEESIEEIKEVSDNKFIGIIEENIKKVESVKKENEVVGNVLHENEILVNKVALYVKTTSLIDCKTLLETSKVVHEIDRVVKLQTKGSYLVIFEVKSKMDEVMKIKKIKDVLAQINSNLMTGSTQIKEESMNQLIDRTIIEINKQIEKSVIERKEKY